MTIYSISIDDIRRNCGRFDDLPAGTSACAQALSQVLDKAFGHLLTDWKKTEWT
jgi:hypothetical protein